MFLQKTLHLNQTLEGCKTRLVRIQSRRQHFAQATEAIATSSTSVDFSFRGPLGLNARTVLLSLDRESPDQMAFESIGGNLDVMGLVEFVEIRPNWTEDTLALHYQIKNRLFAWLDRRFHFMEAFVASEFRATRAHFEEIAATRVQPKPAPMLSMLAAGN